MGFNDTQGKKSIKKVLAMYFVSFLFLSIFVPEFLAENYTNRKLPYKNEYGEGYGIKWIFIPDEDGNPKLVNLQEPISPRNLMEPDYKIQFRLYTRRNVRNYVLLDEFANTLNETQVPFVTGAPVKIITHGWMSSADKNSVIIPKTEYLKAYDCNVIGVDWSDTADFLVYPSVALQTKAISMIVGVFLDALGERYGVTGDQIHLIGHSLGAHIMGGAASSSKMRVGRVTGLDPASPMFDFPPVPDNFKLDKTDAKFVDVIHTCSSMLGIKEPAGHVDFYPNNGYAPQPGCEGTQAWFEACSHSRAHFYFSESINNPEAFPSSNCGSWNDFRAHKCEPQTVYMGEHLPSDTTGVFYLTTNPVQPFGRRYN